MINYETTDGQVTFDDKDELAVNTLRMLSIDAIEKAKSGHPGLCLDAAPMAYVLWNYHMNTNPSRPNWINRDRFVLSAGHGSALLYSLLHMSGYAVSLDDLKQFRQLGSLTPGHPEFGHTPGVDATTGPLGQGIGMAVGMALAEKHLAAKYNTSKYSLIDHWTYSLVGDGDLMEGISQEAINIAAKEKLNKLIVLYDSNDITLDGPLSNGSIESEKLRFQGAGWNYLRVEDGEDLDDINAAINRAKHSSQPTIIEIKTQIGYGSPQAGTNAVHGAALGADNLKKTKEFFNWTQTPFAVQQDAYAQFKQGIERRGEDAQHAWQEMYNEYQRHEPELAEHFTQEIGPKLDMSQVKLPDQKIGEAVATRVTSSALLQEISKYNPNFWGGAADLSSSNKTQLKGAGRFSPETPENDNLWFGVREFGEAAALNGITLHGGSRVFGSTFFTFSDYMKGAIRLSALQKLPVTYIFTHDTVAVGEDGPTHEPIEQLAGVRSIPNLNVIRPADAHETLGAWQTIAETTDKPTVLVLSRQGLPLLDQTKPENVLRGGYVVSPAKSQAPDGILIASGSEVQLAIDAQKALREKQYDLSVVSMPSFELFDAQSQEYKDSVLPPQVDKRISLEMDSTFGWAKYTGLNGVNMGIDTFGASGKGPEVIKHFGFTVDNVVAKYEELWKRNE
ncbi:transketolase [Levilactobacillus namurensis]|uniref:transketolase n=1 Tax=Levilactobacillus namurensis TaxID=380393 RepID=UPI00222E3F51|nr:transketolase [Levilactobacillus namurensis]MCW3779212.1 transketolase [Levilactobacillus namurensis]MDT7019955.1 transketolase [Levilactobacillus namurensis]WNN65467.1 transketolase [Levilactobacillus namurensis]